MKNVIRNTAMALSVLAISACTMIPGSHLSGADYFDQSTEQAQVDLDNVKITAIDSSLLAQQQILRSKNNAQLLNSNSIKLDDYEYHIGIRDVLTIGVWEHPELTIPAAVQRTAAFDGFRVQSDGTITFAYAPKIAAAGKTITELHDILVTKLSKVIENPQVDIKVVGFNSQKTYITGEVNKPGVQPITEIPLTLIDAINQAGGITNKADWTHITFTRNKKTELIKLNDFYQRGDISQNRLLQNGDIVHVARTDLQKVFVLGDVKNAGMVDVTRYGISLAEALANAGGINEQTADANGIFVLRKKDIKKDGVIADVYQLHAKNALALVLAGQFKLEPQDIVYVTTAPVARWNRLISQLIPTLTTIDQISETEARGNIF
ncbi:polysaccharide biosynthesis/export family protein [Shewanella sp. 202IG2-18]|uniref:polysaccharide export protein n=1 Tax=Parashewanella hymeniacidonis TaxID=2807618 RepID=UPI001962219E|nr:polysaccharide export protein [Parashewanella hymeniacidonis]MBM7072024.1 polysaccharide biosynthesis/export family protein [Parashewanella hymeniacidonis]